MNQITLSDKQIEQISNVAHKIAEMFDKITEVFKRVWNFVKEFFQSFNIDFKQVNHFSKIMERTKSSRIKKKQLTKIKQLLY